MGQIRTIYSGEGKTAGTACKGEETKRYSWGKAILVDRLTKWISSYEIQSTWKSKMSTVCYTSVTCSEPAWCEKNNFTNMILAELCTTRWPYRSTDFFRLVNTFHCQHVIKTRIQAHFTDNCNTSSFYTKKITEIHSHQNIYYHWPFIL